MEIKISVYNRIYNLYHNFVMVYKFKWRFNIFIFMIFVNYTYSLFNNYNSFQFYLLKNIDDILSTEFQIK